MVYHGHIIPVVHTGLQKINTGPWSVIKLYLLIYTSHVPGSSIGKVFQKMDVFLLSLQQQTRKMTRFLLRQLFIKK